VVDVARKLAKEDYGAAEEGAEYAEEPGELLKENPVEMTDAALGDLNRDNRGAGSVGGDGVGLEVGLQEGVGGIGGGVGGIGGGIGGIGGIGRK
jgi:hypothetical protein